MLKVGKCRSLFHKSNIKIHINSPFMNLIGMNSILSSFKDRGYPYGRVYGQVLHVIRAKFTSIY